MSLRDQSDTPPDLSRASEERRAAREAAWAERDVPPDIPGSPWRVGAALRDEFDAGFDAGVRYAEGENERLLDWLYDRRMPAYYEEWEEIRERIRAALSRPAEGQHKDSGDPYEKHPDPSLTSQTNQRKERGSCGEGVQAAEASAVGTMRRGSAGIAATSGIPSMDAHTRPLATMLARVADRLPAGELREEVVATLRRSAEFRPAAVAEQDEEGAR